MNESLNEAVEQLKKAIEQRLKIVSEQIIKEETEKIFSRVKIVTHKDLNKGYVHWYIEPNSEDIKWI